MKGLNINTEVDPNYLYRYKLTLYVCRISIMTTFRRTANNSTPQRTQTNPRSKLRKVPWPLSKSVFSEGLALAEIRCCQHQLTSLLYLLNTEGLNGCPQMKIAPRALLCYFGMRSEKCAGTLKKINRKKLVETRQARSQGNMFLFTAGVQSINHNKKGDRDPGLEQSKHILLR